MLLKMCIFARTKMAERRSRGTGSELYYAVLIFAKSALLLHNQVLTSLLALTVPSLHPLLRSVGGKNGKNEYFLDFLP